VNWCIFADTDVKELGLCEYSEKVRGVSSCKALTSARPKDMLKACPLGHDKPEKGKEGDK